MSISFFIASTSRAPNASRIPSSLSAMSAREDAERFAVGTVVRRRSEEVVEEMAKLAEGEKARMVAQASPSPTVIIHLDRYSARPPIRHRARRPINPAPPPSPEEIQVAAIRRREHRAAEAHILEEGRRLMERPRTPTPPRRADDPFDLARWAFRRGY